MLPDILSVAMRALSFVSALQAAGAALFLVMFGRWLAGSTGGIRRIARYAALIGIAFVCAHTGLEAARMAGDMSGMFDASLQRIVLESSAAAAASARILGLALVALAAGSKGPTSIVTSVSGAILVTFSFVLTGHTAVHEQRWLLAPVLWVHVAIVAFWFGALMPLYVVSHRESLQVTARVVAAFSALAIYLVPVIFIAGLV